MKYVVATGVSVLILAIFVLVAVVARWTHGGGYLVQVALWSIVFVTWRSIVGNWDRIVARIQRKPNTTHAPIFEAHVKATVVAGILIIGIVAFIGVMRSRGQHKAESGSRAVTRQNVNPGAMPYIPSRLEWLSVDLTASIGSDYAENHRYSVGFFGDEKKDTLVIAVVRGPNMTLTDRQCLDVELQSARKIISANAESLGWSSWLNVEVEESDLP